MINENQSELDFLIVSGKIKRASELLAEGNFFAAARILPNINTFEVMRLRLLIENGARNEEELSHLREKPLADCETFQNLLALCNDEQKEDYLRIDEACTLNEEIRNQLERGYDLINYGYYTEASSFAMQLVETYPDRAEIWNMIILAKSKVVPARDFDTEIVKRSASLEKYTEYKELTACSDYVYFKERPEYSERYLKTKTDIMLEKKEQVVREKTALSVVFSRITLALGVASLCTLLPFFAFFDSVGGIITGVIGMMFAVAGVACNVRVNMLDKKKTVKESTLSYVLLLLLMLAYVITLSFGIPRAI